MWKQDRRKGNRTNRTGKFQNKFYAPIAQILTAQKPPGGEYAHRRAFGNKLEPSARYCLRDKEKTYFFLSISQSVIILYLRVKAVFRKRLQLDLQYLNRVHFLSRRSKRFDDGEAVEGSH